MKNLFSFLLLIAGMFFINNSAFAQRGFEDYGTEEGIRIQYSWGREKLHQAEGNAALSLRLTNTHDYSVQVNLAISFYRDHQAFFESRGNVYCLKPGQSLRGALAGMRFVAEGVSLTDVKQEWFSWEVSEISAEEVTDCE